MTLYNMEKTLNKADFPLWEWVPRPKNEERIDDILDSLPDYPSRKQIRSAVEKILKLYR